MRVLFQCRPERIDNGEFKDNDPDDGRQPEIAISLPKTEVLILLYPKVW